jgi:hypothetical protein
MTGMDFIFQKTSKPDDVVSIRIRDATSYTLSIKNRTEGYSSEGILQDYEVKQYIELLYLSALYDDKGYDDLQINFPTFPAIMRNLKNDSFDYACVGDRFPFLSLFSTLITFSLKLEEWPVQVGMPTS